MYSITNDFDGILAGIPNGGGRKLLDSCAIMGYVLFDKNCVDDLAGLYDTNSFSMYRSH